MLPDYPSLKKDILEVLHIFFRKRVEEYAIVARHMPKTRMFEEEGTVIRRATGEDDPTSFMHSEITFNVSPK